MRARPLTAAVLLFASSAFAQLNRTAVSIGGSDLNSCSVSSPCRSFAAALLQTAVGGELVALDSGGFGTMQITQSVTVEGAPGVYAGVTFSGGLGVFINSGGATIVLRGLTVTGPPLSGTTGIRIFGGADVHVEHCIVRGGEIAFYGTNTQGSLTVSDSVFRDALHTGAAISNDSGSTSRSVFNHCRFEANGSPTSSNGLLVSEFGDVVVRDSLAIGQQGSGAGFDAVVTTMNGAARLVLENCLSAGNAYGVASGGAGAVVTVSTSTVTRNGTGLNFSNGGVLRSLHNNTVQDNGSDGVFSTTTALQ